MLCHPLNTFQLLLEEEGREKEWIDDVSRGWDYWTPEAARLLYFGKSDADDIDKSGYIHPCIEPIRRGAYGWVY